MEIIYHNRKINLTHIKKLNSLEKFIGLMLCRRRKAYPLLFEFKKPEKIKIHSLFVFFDFIALWLDENNRVIEKKKIKPFRLNVGIKKSFSKLVEIPVNEKNKDVLQFLDES